MTHKMAYPYFMLVIFFLPITIVVAEFKQIDLVIHQSYMDPDCSGTSYPVVLINNQFPAPTIRISKDDEVEIRVFNQANAPSSIHFHGIRQYGSVEADGVPDVTQNAIEPGSSFIHRFQLQGQAGTFYYHAHVGVQDDTVQGAFIVDNTNSDSTSLMKSPNGGDNTGYVYDCDYDDNYVYDCDFNNMGYTDNDDTAENALVDQLLNYFDMDERRYPYYDGPYGYDDELLLHLSEWWHQPFYEREAYYLGPNYSHDPNADSILFNGRTVHQPYSAAQPHCPGHTIIDVLPNQTYRLRIIGGNTFRTYGLGIKDHNMTIIEVDGELIQPYSTTHLEITPGQRFSVLIHTDDLNLRYDENMFAIATSYRHRHRATGYTENGFGYLRYVNDPYQFNKRDKWLPNRKKRALSHRGGKNDVLPPTHQNPKQRNPEKHHHKKKKDTHRSKEGPPEQGDETEKPKVVHENFPEIPDIVPRDWIWPDLRPLAAPAPWLHYAPDRTLKIRSWTTIMPDGSTRYLVNHRLPHIYDVAEKPKSMNGYKKMENPNDPMPNHFTLLKMQSATTQRTMELDEDGFESTLGTYPIGLNETVDIVFQNAKVGRNCLLHPWHTHGHSHYVIASGDGEYIHERDHAIRNFPHPIYKDVSVVYETKADPHSNGCGWTKIRIYADNPGVWAVHCHITAHMLQGKMFLLEEASDWIDTFRMYK